MEARIDYYGDPGAAKFLKSINAAGRAISESTLPPAGGYVPGQWS
ncbi:hypothetical protein [Actinocorallia longicatena]|uniref:Uncharacterized protein n=1 Tax=Actinocorallia longicatena TaxID=111803 RepID=A0ABP6Q3R4_9ACTN